MPQPVDLLLITWNRREYVEKTLPTLLNDQSDFRLYCWDNNSQDGTKDLIASIKDPRVVKRHFNDENVGQYDPCMWFFETAESDVIGKVDDDILLPSGWTQRIAPMIRKEPKFGMLGCWIFMPEDWDETLAVKNIITLAEERVFRCVHIQGQSFLARREYLLHYRRDPIGHGLPVQRIQMSIDGLVSGYPLPLICAHNMDDPRSPFNITMKDGSLGSYSAQTARKLGFESAEAYASWIVADARSRQEQPYEQSLKKLRRRMWQGSTRVGKLHRKLSDFFTSVMRSD